VNDARRHGIPACRNVRHISSYWTCPTETGLPGWADRTRTRKCVREPIVREVFELSSQSYVGAGGLGSRDHALLSCKIGIGGGITPGGRARCWRDRAGHHGPRARIECREGRASRWFSGGSPRSDHCARSPTPSARRLSLPLLHHCRRISYGPDTADPFRRDHSHIREGSPPQQYSFSASHFRARTT
jgi:hypothetical protein